ncbi:type II secretion system F family protein [Paraburkholderia acidisoli]|uniref:Type II secretion system F family protein n=1 Tax=Paraburkholderia acidisoli TaxID=2571748 RepID=A0A7Z2JGC0_9BURK|nr:type II secretion system F family protein [Paraburkholderia acidisoli]QGZ62813.1 type II secretion system F family protein [Paraburkholderia acidisoli]
MSVAAGNLVLIGLLIAGVYLYIRTGNSTRARVSERARAMSLAAHSINPNAGENANAGLLGRVNKLSRLFALVGERLPLFDAKQRAKLALACRRAGFYGHRAMSMLVGLKFTCGIAAGACAVVFGAKVPVFGQFLILRAMLMLAAFIIGMIVPEYFLSFMARRRRRQIARVLPDALDLLVICTNAGHSLAVGIQRVAKEIRTVSVPLADELDITSSELHLGGDAAIALNNLSDRIDLPSVRSLVSTLVQSQQYGTPITSALKTLSKGSRAQAMLELEEKAAKLAPKMTLPMMLFILPTVTIVAAGPAVLRLLTVFGK